MAATTFGRYVCQLRKLRITFCKGGESSSGLRDYVEFGLPELAATNPQTVFHVRHVGGRQPVLTAEYLNGKTKRVCIRSQTPEQVEESIIKLLNQEGIKASRYKASQKSARPSVQGNWNPFLKFKS